MIPYLEVSATKTLPFLCLPVVCTKLNYVGWCACRHQAMFWGDRAGLIDFSVIFFPHKNNFRICFDPNPLLTCFEGSVRELRTEDSWRQSISVCKREREKRVAQEHWTALKVISNFQMQQWAKETKRRTCIKSQADALENTAVGSHRFWPSKPNSIIMSVLLFYFRHWKAIIRCSLSFLHLQVLPS